MNDTICLYKSHDSMEANLIKSLLESASIDCYLQSDDAGGMLPYLTFSNGITILIRPEDQQEAEELLHHFLDR